MNNKLILILLGGLAMAACGGSSSSSPPTASPVTTTDIVTGGPITGFGSVIVNGTAFNTDTATVIMDGEPAVLSDLRVGMIVSVRGTVQQATRLATASAIHFSDDAEGPVTSINRVTNTLLIMGRTVLVDELTVFEGTTLDELVPGNVVQVSGLWRHQERIQARHIRKVANAWAAGMQMEVKGTVNGLDPGNLRFRIGTQWCDYSGATLELGGETLANGMIVEVSSASPMAGGDMFLDRIRLHDRDRDRLCDGDCDFELEGYVTSYVSATDFEVDSQPVSTSSSTIFINGTAENLALDVMVSVDGTVDDSGVLIADRIVFHLPSLAEIEADIEMIDAGNATVTVLGVAVVTNEFTLFRDHGAVGALEFGFDDLAVGDRVEIRAYLDQGSVVATRLERDDPDDGVTLKAPVESIDRPAVTLLGITVMSDQDTVFQDQAKQVIDADTFFTLVTTDSLVRAEGTYDGASVLASKLFLRDCANSCL